MTRGLRRRRLAATTGNGRKTGRLASVGRPVLALAASLLLCSMLDVVHVEGDHTSFLVLAPRPTLGFVHGGGEEGAWRRAHPGQPEPWWLRGHYVVVAELTDG